MSLKIAEKDEFYDLENDPGELRNEIDNPKYGGEIRKLRDRLLDCFQATADVVPFAEDRR